MGEREERARQLAESRTCENLKQAFQADAQAASRYAFFAHRADQEGQLDAEGIFSALARGKESHAARQLGFLREVRDPQTGVPIGSTLLNLRSALERARYEQGTLFPGFATTARGEGFDSVAEWFETQAEAAKNHADRLQGALDALEASLGQD